MVVVTIDGPSGAGKSSSARELARRLGFDFLDTGAMYRAVTLAAFRSGCSLQDEPQLDRLLQRVVVRMAGDSVFLGEEDVSAAIRDPDITRAASPLSAFPRVREHLVRWQRQFAEGRNVVTEGRDQGAVVFPDAACKFYLDADAGIRARRRVNEMLSKGKPAAFDEVLADQMERDERDMKRAVSPLTKPAGAIIIDSTHLTFEGVVECMEREVRRRLT